LDEELEESEEKSNFERSLPPYTCNIYEGLMVFTINVRNVVANSLEKSVLKNENGYYLTFHTMGQGFVPFYYGFCLAFDFEPADYSLGSCSLDDLEVEVWDNNMILQLSMPKSGCSVYQVGTDEYDLCDSMALPRLEMAKEKFKLKDKVAEQLSKVDLDSDDSSEEGLNQSDDKERHSSGESNDSAISVTPPSLNNSESSTSSRSSTQDCQSPSKRFLVIPAKLSSNNNAENGIGEVAREINSNNLRGILKRARCLSESQAEYLSLVTSVIDSGSSTSSTIIGEDIADQNAGKSNASSADSKKSVRFNEVVQRQVYRQNASILGQKIKNMKKAEQKRRKAEQKRRASEGDLPENGSSVDGFKKISASYTSDSDHITNDSGLASSVDESSEDKKKEKRLKKGHRSKGSNNKKVENIANHHSADLIFNLDF